MNQEITHWIDGREVYCGQSFGLLHRYRLNGGRWHWTFRESVMLAAGEVFLQ